MGETPAAATPAAETAAPVTSQAAVETPAATPAAAAPAAGGAAMPSLAASLPFVGGLIAALAAFKTRKGNKTAAAAATPIGALPVGDRSTIVLVEQIHQNVIDAKSVEKKTSVKAKVFK
ncbi:MAG: hypothetical protein WC184_11785 [Acidimicrobiia bacterium]